MEYKGEPRVIHEKRDLKRLTKRRQVITQVLEVIVIILLLLLCLHGGIIWHNTNTIETNICNPLKNAVLSINCTDGNPCTTDRRIAIPTTGCSGSGVTINDTCIQYACEHIPLADGACCNMNDFCYYDDPNKKCMLGNCITDPTLCKGYCVEEGSGPESICNDLPFITSDNMLSVAARCLNHSCVYTVIVEMYIADPYSLLAVDPTNLTDFNITSCLLASCTYGYIDDYVGPDNYNFYSMCTFTYTCAPRLFPVPGTGKKRGENEEIKLIAVPFTGYKMYGKNGLRLPPPYPLFSPDPKLVNHIDLNNESTMPITTAYPMLNVTSQLYTHRATFNALKSLFTQHLTSLSSNVN
jgi:hypothetical protein